MRVERYEALLAVLGLAALLAAWVPAYTDRRPVSLPIVLLAIGFGLSLVPLDAPSADPRRHLELVERGTELGVIVSLTGCGLKIDRPFSWSTWSGTWRMLGIAMPITIALIALTGAGIAALPLASAALLGAALAPTDPVLASDVQVGEPTLEDQGEIDEAEGDVRFVLTSEGGLNDALAFPFVYGAMRLVDREGSWVEPITTWLAWDVVGRVAIGIAGGLAVGALIGRIAFRPPGRLQPLADSAQGFVALAVTLLAYGCTEAMQGYGFLAVFVAAVTLRSFERHHEFHAALHGFSEQFENVLVVGLLLLLGASLTAGPLGALDWRVAIVAVTVVFVIRPLAGLIALVGTPLSSAERRALAFFGVRGFGSIYYLAYALSAKPFADQDALWSITLCVLVVSILSHGIAASPAMSVVDRAAQRRRRR